MSCKVESSSSKMSYVFNKKTYYTINFKDNITACVLRDTLLDTIKTRMNSIESIVKFKYDEQFDIHYELLIFADHMKVLGSEYITVYENLTDMYGVNPLDDVDRKIIMQLNECT